MTSTGAFFAGPPDDPTRYHVTAADLRRGIAGGEGLVYRACRTGTDDVVALKVLAGTQLTDFDRRAERSDLLVGVRHPNLMEQVETFLGCPLSERTVQAIEDFDVPYSVARWIDGVPLTEAITGATPTQVLGWVVDLAAALHHLHSPSAAAPDGVVHRDLKPSNIRIRHDGSAVLLDYGVAREVDPDDMTGGVGTYLWRAPEVLGGPDPAGTAADVWGLGAVAHWMCTGEPPRLDGAAAARERLLASPVLAALDRPGPVARHLSELLASSPTERPADLRDWSRRLGRLTRDRRFGRGARFGLGAVAAVVTAGVLLSGVGVVGDEPTSLEVADASPVSASSTSSTTASFGTTISCSGFSSGAMVASPSIADADASVVLSLVDPSTSVWCVDGNQAFPLTFPILSLRFDRLGCDALRDAATRPVEAVGIGIVRWDGGSSSIEVASSLDQPFGGTIEVAGLDGRLEDYRGTAEFVVVGVDRPCDQGITTAFVNLREITLRHTS